MRLTVGCLLGLLALLGWGHAGSSSEAPELPKAVRFPENPIVKPGMDPTIGNNINGPSLIRVPKWLKNPLGRYYLYFADHGGKYIRLAYSDTLAGPWKIYGPGTLQISQTPCRGHIASPDVHVDDRNQGIRMYFHGPVSGQQTQVSLVAVSSDGIQFAAAPEILGESYFRVFQWGGSYYAIARAGTLYRSRDGLKNFEQGPNPFAGPQEYTVRHNAVKVDGDVLSVFYSRIGDNPERIMVSTMRLKPDWNQWTPSAPVTILEPQQEYEGADLPLLRSAGGAARGRLRELRDPAIYREGKRTYLLYSVAGESGIAIAELK